MTQKELNEYNRLTPKQKDAYNFGKNQHPEWTHEQTMTYVYVVCVFEPPKEPKTLKEVFEETVRKAGEFLRHDFPRIYMQVKEKFTQVLNRLSNAISATWNAIIEWFNS